MCQVERGFNSSLNGSFQEICGDGFNLGSYHCDDGNLINGDGCDGMCEVEPGWTCSGGSSINSDICRPIEMPIVEKIFMDDELIRVQFNTSIIVKSEFTY